MSIFCFIITIPFSSYYQTRCYCRGVYAIAERTHETQRASRGGILISRVRNHPHKDALLRRIYERVPVKLDRCDFDAPHFKTFLLLQAHFSCIQLPPDLAADQVLVLEKILNLLSACVDVLSSNAWLNALGAMDLSQMCAQAMWETDSPLKQIPHFDPDVKPFFVEISDIS